MWSSWKQSDRLFLELTWPMHGRVKYLKKGPLGLYPTLLSTKSGWRLYNYAMIFVGLQVHHVWAILKTGFPGTLLQAGCHIEI